MTTLVQEDPDSYIIVDQELGTVRVFRIAKSRCSSGHRKATKSKDRHCVRRGKALRLVWGISPTRKLFASSGSSRGGGGGNKFTEALRCQRAAWRFSELTARNVQ